MDPEDKEKEELARQKQAKRVLYAVAIGAPILAIATFLVMPPRPDGTVVGWLEGFTDRPNDGSDVAWMSLILPDGSAVSLAPSAEDRDLPVGSTVCLARTRHPLTGAVRYRRATASLCDL